MKDPSSQARIKNIKLQKNRLRINLTITTAKKKICKNTMMKNLKITFRSKNKRRLANPQLQGKNFKISKRFMRMKSVIPASHLRKNQKQFKHSKINKSLFLQTKNNEYHKKYKNVKKQSGKKDIMNCTKELKICKLTIRLLNKIIHHKKSI